MMVHKTQHTGVVYEPWLCRSHAFAYSERTQRVDLCFFFETQV